VGSRWDLAVASRCRGGVTVALKPSLPAGGHRECAKPIRSRTPASSSMCHLEQRARVFSNMCRLYLPQQIDGVKFPKELMNGQISRSTSRAPPPTNVHRLPCGSFSYAHVLALSDCGDAVSPLLVSILCLAWSFKSVRWVFVVQGNWRRHTRLLFRLFPDGEQERHTLQLLQAR
jgi:hypothetical protein